MTAFKGLEKIHVLSFYCLKDSLNAPVKLASFPPHDSAFLFRASQIMQAYRAVSNELSFEFGSTIVPPQTLRCRGKQGNRAVLSEAIHGIIACGVGERGLVKRQSNN